MLLPFPIAVPIYTIYPRNKVRILLSYGDTLRPILWLSIGKDGSIYFSPRIKNFINPRCGKEESVGDKFTYKYGSGVTISDQSDKINPKISIHASGLVHLNSKLPFKFNIDPLADLAGQKELCIGMLKHPSCFDPVDAIRKYDILIPHPIDEMSPLHFYLCVSKSANHTIIYQRDSAHETHLIFHCTGLASGEQDMFVGLALRHGPKGPWPPENVLIFRHENKE